MPSPWLIDDRQIEDRLPILQRTKEATVAAMAADLIPTITGFKDHVPVVTVYVNTAGDDPSDELRDVAFMVATSWDTDAVVVVCEAYYRHVPKDRATEALSAQHGDLRRDFATNLDSDVLEAVTVTRIDRTDDEASDLHVLPFVMADVGRIEWKDREELDGAGKVRVRGEVWARVVGGWRYREQLAAAGHVVDLRSMARTYAEANGHGVTEFVG